MSVGDHFYESLDHTADAAIRVWGGSWEELLRNAGRAFYDLITDWRSIQPGEEERVVEVVGDDRVEVLVAFLGELLYLFDTERLLFGEIEFLAARKDMVKAAVRGEGFDLKRHPLKSEVKAVTYHCATVEDDDGRWTAELVFDL